MTQKNKANSDVCIHLVLHPVKMSGEWIKLQPFFISVDKPQLLYLCSYKCQWLKTSANHISAAPNLIDFWLWHLAEGSVISEIPLKRFFSVDLFFTCSIFQSPTPHTLGKSRFQIILLPLPLLILSSSLCWDAVSVSRDGIEVIYFTKLIHLWLQKTNQKLKLFKPQTDVICKAAHSPAISTPERKSGAHNIDASWLILSTRLDYWNSKIKGKKGFKPHLLSYRYTL